MTADEQKNLADYDVVIIGGGPAGLWTAANIKCRKPDAKICILEKRDSYVRNNRLKLQSSSFATPPHSMSIKSNTPDPFADLVALKNKFFARSFFLLGLRKTAHIEIKTLEAELKRICQDKGVEIHQEEVADANALITRCKENAIIVAADGARSKMRPQLFGSAVDASNPTTEDSNKIKKKSIQNVAQFRYRVTEKPKAMSTFGQAYKTQKLAHYFGAEAVSSKKEIVNEQEEERHYVTIRFFVDNDEEYAKLASATAANPWRFGENQKPLLDGVTEAPKLFSSLTRWINVREDIFEESMVPDSLELSSFELGMYQSPQFYTEKEGRSCYLVGDAAFGVPYYKSGNNAFVASSHLGAQIATELTRGKKIEKSITSSFSSGDTTVGKQYNEWMTKFANNEVRLAKRKNIFVNFGKWWIKISAKVPWQSNRWSQREKQRYNNFHHIAPAMPLANHPTKDQFLKKHTSLYLRNTDGRYVDLETESKEMTEAELKEKNAVLQGNGIYFVTDPDQQPSKPTKAKGCIIL